jgi:hypothetical protein
MRACRGCDAGLTDTHGGRVWCSERCRKAAYGQPCVDCGTRTIYGAEHARKPEPRCAACQIAHSRVDPQVLAETIALYRGGLSLAAVGERLGVSTTAVHKRLVAAGEPRRPLGRPKATERERAA